MNAPTLFVDADGCPVKNEVFTVANRHELRVALVSNSPLRVPANEKFEAVVVGGGFDAADDWIVEHVEAGDIVVTADIPLAARCLEKKAKVLAHDGKPFTEQSIGDALAGRELMAELRDMGLAPGGPKPFSQRDRSNFLHQLHEAVVKGQRERGGG